MFSCLLVFEYSIFGLSLTVESSGEASGFFPTESKHPGGRELPATEAHPSPLSILGVACIGGSTQPQTWVGGVSGVYMFL